jgi:transcriptional regulator of acetoin/glycerol metabolism
MCDGDVIDVPDLRLDSDQGAAPTVTDGPPSLTLQEVEAWAIRKAMRQTNWSIKLAAKILDINRDTLASKLRKYGIDKA